MWILLYVKKKKESSHGSQDSNAPRSNSPPDFLGLANLANSKQSTWLLCHPLLQLRLFLLHPLLIPATCLCKLAPHGQCSPLSSAHPKSLSGTSYPAPQWCLDCQFLLWICATQCRPGPSESSQVSGRCYSDFRFFINTSTRCSLTRFMPPTPQK